MSPELDYRPVMTMPLSKDMTGDGILPGLVCYWQDRKTGKIIETGERKEFSTQGSG